uniref:Golgi-associated, gamma adaptin ear containing, ARF binding protein 1 n=1 Tax=Sander lucioperca TaxID=283035 RepID=A0A8D0DH25_SANLU
RCRIQPDVFSFHTDKATNPLNKETDWDNIKGFFDQLNNEPDGPQLATRLLAHKIQSPQEWEAMQALMVLETCMKNCGKRFHSEVGKFRFLNELIKVVSPKYLGTRAPEPVKKKVLEIMYSWTVRLPGETKIADAYQMLKKQGIVKLDPVLPDDKPLPPPPPRAKNVIFEDEEKSKVSVIRRSAKMLQFHNDPGHCEILSLFFQDQKRVEKVSKRLNAIQEVKESVNLLSQLLEGYSKQSCSQSNQELIKDLYQRCEKMRPTLFRLASDTEDSDEALAEILEANDSLTQVINMYRQLVKGEDVSKDGITSPSQPGRYMCSTPKGLTISNRKHCSQTAPNSSFVVQPLPPDKFQPQSRVSLRDMQTKSAANCRAAPNVTPASSGPAPAPAPGPASSLSLHSELPDTLLLSNLSFAAATDPYDNISLAEVTVSLEAIKPSSLLPVTVFDKHSLRVLFTFARDCPPSRPDVLVVIISMLSSAPIPVTNIRFQAAVPKVMKVKLQPPSSTELPAFNPILPPAAITQILLLANPHKEKVRLRYKLTFNLGEQSHDESGDVDQFPPPNTWGNL